MHPFVLQAKLLYRSKAEKHLNDQCITALKHTQTYTHSQWFYISSEAHTVHSIEYGEWSRVDRPFRRICLRVLINLNAAIGVFIRIFVKGTQIMRSEPSETTVLSYDFIKSAIKCSLVWGGGSDKPSFFFLSDLCSSWSASCCREATCRETSHSGRQCVRNTNSSRVAGHEGLWVQCSCIKGLVRTSATLSGPVSPTAQKESSLWHLPSTPLTTAPKPPRCHWPPAACGRQCGLCTPLHEVSKWSVLMGA